MEVPFLARPGVGRGGGQLGGEEPGGHIRSGFPVSVYLGNGGWRPGGRHGLASGASPEPGEVLWLPFSSILSACTCLEPESGDTG